MYHPLILTLRWMTFDIEPNMRWKLFIYCEDNLILLQFVYALLIVSIDGADDPFWFYEQRVEIVWVEYSCLVICFSVWIKVVELMNWTMILWYCGWCEPSLHCICGLLMSWFVFFVEGYQSIDVSSFISEPVFVTFYVVDVFCFVWGFSCMFSL